MRPLTPEAARAIVARDSDEPILALVSFTGQGLDPIRIVHNTESITRNGQVYRPWAFEGPPPEDGAALSTEITLSIDNIDPKVTRQIRDYQGIPLCEIVWVMGSQPNQALYGPFEFAVLSAKANEVTIQTQLGYEENTLNQAFPGQTYSPTNSAGMYV